MSKKVSKNKTSKKAVKSTKSKPAPKKGKPASAAKKSKGKPAVKPKAKAVKPAKKSAGKPAPKPAKKAVAKKSKPLKKVIKAVKVSKPVKKATSKALTKGKPSTKPISKSASKLKKPITLIKTVKSSKPAGKKTLPKKPVKSVKPDKPVKPAKAEKPVKQLPVKASKEKESKEKPVLPVPTGKVKPVKKGKGGRKPKGSGDDDEPEIVHDELIEQLIQSTKKQRQPKVPKMIKTFVNPISSLAVALPPGGIKKGAAPKKEPKGKFELEYVVRTSAGILYELLTTPSGLSEWFADDVNIRDGIFTFFWDGSEQKARLLGFKEEKYVRLQWLDKPEGSYFEFRIEKDELTGDISLMIVDFADEASDQQTSKLLWDSQVNKLLHVLGN